MHSIYRHALGDAFEQLHPKMQQRFGFDSTSGLACIGRGVMSRIWRGAECLTPFLALGAKRNIMFPDEGVDIPFTIQNHAYVDALGRETVTWLRTFFFPLATGPRCFDAYMVYAPERRCIVDYLGTHEHLATDLTLAVSDQGGLRLRSGPLRFYEGGIGLTFPPALSARADVHEWFDESRGCYRISVDVRNSILGPVFGYTGAFDIEWRDAASAPARVMPARLERRP